MSTTPNQKDLLAKKTDLEGILKPDANDILHLPEITITLAESGQFYLAGISKKLLTLIGNTSGNAVTLDGDAGLTFTTSGGSSTITGITNSNGNSTSLAASQSMVSAKQDTLTAGTNITISNNTISATDTNTLSDLTDTAFSSLADGQILKYNATSRKWVNGTGGGGAEVILGTTAPTAAQGSNGNLYIQYDDTNNNTVTHEYVKISGAWEEIAIGGGGADLPNNYIVTADSLKIKNEAPSTGVDWIVEDDTDYFDSEASITVSTRVYQKTNAVPALGGVYTVYASGNIWTTVMFTSTDATAVAYSGNTDPFGSFTYLGYTWYFSGTEYALSGDYSSEVSGARYIGDFSQYDYSTKECCIEAAKRLIDYAGISFEENNFTTISRPSTGYIIAGGGSTSDFSDATFKVTKQGAIYGSDIIINGNSLLSTKQNTLTKGNYINIDNDIISVTAIDSQTYEGDLVSRVPAADTHITASTSNSSYPAWGAFNGTSPSNLASPDADSCWLPEVNLTDQWIQYHFDSAKYFTSLTIDAFSNYSDAWVGTIKVEGSNDGTTFTNILENGSTQSITAPLRSISTITVDLDDSNTWTYIRITFVEAMSIAYYPSLFIDEIHFYGGSAGGNNIVSLSDFSKLSAQQISDLQSAIGRGGSYSTTEQVIGTWIDGSPLYQKTYYYPGTLSRGATYLDQTLTSSNVDYFTHCDMSYVVNNNYRGSGFQIETGVLSGGVFISPDNAPNVSYSDIYVTVRYTKII